jgi:hypothetical protein
MTGWIQKIIDNITGLFSTQIYFGITVAPSATMTINNDVLCIGDIDIGTGSTLIVNGNLVVAGNIIPSPGAYLQSGIVVCIGNFYAPADGTTIIVLGSCSVAGIFNIGGGTSGTMTVSGNLAVAGNVTLASGASVTVSGYAYLSGAITNSGTLTYHGVYPETAVNISAVSTGATDVINLAAVSGYHYTINKLRLKCADPGANTVTVTLQELINGVLTAVDSFVIIGSLGVNPNYQNYLSLMDMFGLPELFGDQLEVSVESSAGTYAVIGSYSYRSE